MISSFQPAASIFPHPWTTDIGQDYSPQIFGSFSHKPGEHKLIIVAWNYKLLCFFINKCTVWKPSLLPYSKSSIHEGQGSTIQSSHISILRHQRGRSALLLLSEKGFTQKFFCQIQIEPRNMEDKVCLYEKYGFCKHRQECKRIHYSEECKDQGTCKDKRSCAKRHPKSCSKFASGQCRFQTECAYKHPTDITKKCKKLDG